jgi:hypothetical protein
MRFIKGVESRGEYLGRVAGSRHRQPDGS